MKTINYGIVSTATIVARFVEGIRESSFGEVVAIAGRDLKKTQKVAEELAIPEYYDTYQAIYQHEDVDIVYIATYNGGHYKCIKEALNHGKNVLCEKPLCLTAEQTMEVFELAKKQNVFLMEAQKAVFLPAISEVRKILNENVIGEIQWVNIVSSHVGAKRGEWFKKIENGGGIFRGAGTYPLEFLLTTFPGKFERATGFMQCQESISDDNCLMTLKMQEILVSILVTKDIKAESRVEIYGEKGSIVIPNYWKTDRFSLIQQGKTQEFVFQKKSEFVYEINHVNECLLQGKTSSELMTPEVSIEAIRCIDDLYQKELGVLV